MSFCALAMQISDTSFREQVRRKPYKLSLVMMASEDANPFLRDQLKNRKPR